MNKTIAEILIANDQANKRWNDSADRFNKAQHKIMLIWFHVNRVKYGNFVERIKSKLWLFLNKPSTSKVKE